MASAYDDFPYLSQAYAGTHVDVLYSLAHLFALEPAAVETARVLEIGCADGANLVPMAEAFPGGTFVGVDLSEGQIAAGRDRVGQLGLDNLTLVAGDFRTIEGTFDYIIVHGLFSWIPPESRPALLARLKARLAPQGVAFVSYNTRPGFQQRAIVREFLALHGEGETAEARVGHARKLLRWLREASSPHTDDGRLLRRQCELMLNSPDAYLAHGLLSEHNHPLWFHEVVTSANAAGLQYLGDASFGSMLPENLHPEGALAMESAGGGLEAIEQLQDFLTHRSFRRSLFVHDDRVLQRSIPWERASELWLESDVKLQHGRVDDEEPARFVAWGQTFDADDLVLKAGLAVLEAHWPRNIAFDAWVTEVVGRTRCSGIVVRSTLGRNLMALYGRGILQLRPRSVPVAEAIGSHPQVTAWARLRVEMGMAPTDLRHRMCRLEPVTALLIPFLDGQHDLRSLEDVLEHARRHRRVDYEGTPRMALDRALALLRSGSMLLAV